MHPLEMNSRQFSELRHELILESEIERVCGGPLLLAMVPITSAHIGGGIIADRKLGHP